MLLISQLSGVFLLLNWFPWELELLMRLSLSSQMDMCIKILQDQNASKIGVYQNPKMDVYQNAPKTICVSKFSKIGVYQNPKIDVYQHTSKKVGIKIPKWIKIGV